MAFSIFYFLFYLSISLFCCTFCFTQWISIFVDKRVVLPFLFHNLTFSCARSRDDEVARDFITHEIKVYEYNINDKKIPLIF